MYDKIIDALRRNAVEDAIAGAAALVAQRPEDAQAYRWLATAQQMQGEIGAAMASIGRAIELSPEDASLHLMQSGLLLGLRDVEAAQSVLAKANQLDPNQFTAYLMQAQLALGRGDLDEAARLSRLAARVEPEHPRLASIEGLLALRRGQGVDALKMVSAALQRMPDDPQLLYALGFIYLQQGHWAFAEQALRRVIKSVPASRNLHSLIADLIHRQGRPADAAAELAPLLADPDHVAPGLLRYAGQLLLDAGQASQALPLLRNALAKQPRDPMTIASLMEAWRQLDMPEDACAALDAALATTTDSHDLWSARLGFEKPDSDSGRAFVQRWVAAMPNHVPALEAQLQLHYSQGQTSAAESIARRIVEIEPGRSTAEHYLITVLLARDPKAAIDQVQSLIEKSQSPAASAILRRWKACAQDAAGQHANALQSWLEVSAELAPTQLPLWTLTAPQTNWPALAPVPHGINSRPLFLFGAPGSGVEAVAAVMNGSHGLFRADRLGPNPPPDGFQNYHTHAALDAGTLDGKALIDQWRTALPARQIKDNQLIDWLLVWDNALLHAMRPHLPEAMLLFVVRDPRDMLIDWLAFGAAAPLAFDSTLQGAQWLANLLEQIAILSEQELYPHRLVRLDGIVSDPAAVAIAVGDAIQVNLQAVRSTGPVRFPAGHWRKYAQVLGESFALLTPVAMRLGYPEN